MSSRRRFLKSAGVLIALPHLESLDLQASDRKTAAPPVRMVCVGNEFGMYPGAFWPQTFGQEYELTPLLKPLGQHRNDLTVFSHLDHGLKGGHFAVHTFLTGIKSADARFAEDGGISLDQRAAEHVGSQTRFPSLTIGSEGGLHGGCQMSWTRAGTRVPPIPGPRELFRALFLNESKSARAKAEDRISLRNSILDSVREDAQSLRRRLNKSDSRKLEEYFSSVRDVETRLQLELQWQNVPKPTAPFEEPANKGLTKDLPLIYDLMALALETDSTRVATYQIGRENGVGRSDHLARAVGFNLAHQLSHETKETGGWERFAIYCGFLNEEYGRFLQRLRETPEPNGEGAMLDNTLTFFGSASSAFHLSRNYPLILAGGKNLGFKHGQYINHAGMNFQGGPWLGKREPWQDEAKGEDLPLSNLYLTMLKRLGMPVKSFADSSGVIDQV